MKDGITTEVSSSGVGQRYDRIEMLKAFDETKAGVKGLTDSGLLKLPKIFVRPSEELAEEAKHEKAQARVPVIDLSGINDAVSRKQIVEEVGTASETWGFFQVVNHGIPLPVVDGMIDGVRDFHEQDVEEKEKYYTRDNERNVRYHSSYDLFTSRTASWRDTLGISFHHLDPQELPPVIRDSTLEYSNHVAKLANILLGLMSEALGLEIDRLKNMECSEGHRFACHYYPACPEPELAIGTTKHSDPGFITILLQNQDVSSLQVLHEGRWLDIHPIRGGFVVNIGDLLQLVTNGKFKSNEHRAIANRVGPRISVAGFFSPQNKEKIYGPIEELITEESPRVYKDVVLGEYFAKFFITGLDSYRALDYYKV